MELTSLNQRIPMQKKFALRWASAAALMFCASHSAMAADGFKLRFPISGTLGGEIVAPLPSEGWVGSISYTDIDIDKIGGSDGKALTLQKSATFALTPAQLAAVPAVAIPGVGSFTAAQMQAALTGRSATASGLVNVEYKQQMRQANLVLARILDKDVQGGKLALAVNIPYSLSLKSDALFTGVTPNLSPLTPTAGPLQPVAQQVAQSSFNTGYQAALAGQWQAANVNTSGLGDIETSLLWEKTVDKMKIVAGATLALPTGNYNYVEGRLAPNIGYGKYYTFRPGVGVAYTASENVTVGARGSLGFNTKNTENNVRSGDFYVVDLAAAFKTPVGVFGPHMTIMRQYTDDSGGQLGANRVSLTGAGVFAAFPIAAIGAGLNLSYMKTIDARNSLSGSFVQARISKVF
jgi:hypothetical protein